MPIWLMILFIVGGSFGAGYLLVSYFLKRADLKPSYKGLLLGGFTFCGVFLLHFVLKQFGIDLFRGFANQVFQAVLILALLSAPARLLLVRMRSGPELVDLGPSPMRGMSLAFGAFIILFAAGGLVMRSLQLGQAGVSIAQGILFLTLGFAHTQIRSEGIYYAGGLVRWNRMARFEWTRNILTIDLRRPRWWQDRVQLPVPAFLVSQVDELMQQHVSAK